FRGYDARRAIRQQLANGRVAREGSAGSCARTRGVGRGVRSHEGWSHSAKELRWPQISTTRARGRSYGPRNDPDIARPRDTSGNRYLHGGLHHRVAERWPASNWSIRLRSRARTL